MGVCSDDQEPRRGNDWILGCCWKVHWECRLEPENTGVICPEMKFLVTTRDQEQPNPEAAPGGPGIGV